MNIIGYYYDNANNGSNEYTVHNNKISVHIKKTEAGCGCL